MFPLSCRGHGYVAKPKHTVPSYAQFNVLVVTADLARLMRNCKSHNCLDYVSCVGTEQAPFYSG